MNAFQVLVAELAKARSEVDNNDAMMTSHIGDNRGGPLSRELANAKEEINRYQNDLAGYQQENRRYQQQ